MPDDKQAQASFWDTGLGFITKFAGAISAAVAAIAAAVGLWRSYATPTAPIATVGPTVAQPQEASGVSKQTPRKSSSEPYAWIIPPEAKHIFVFFQDPTRLTEIKGCTERAKLSREEFIERFPALRREALGLGRQMILTATPDMNEWVSVPERIRYNGERIERGKPYSCNGPDQTGYVVPL